MKTTMYTHRVVPLTIHSYVQYRYDAIPPFRLLQADYSSTIPGIQYDDSTVSFYTIPQMPLTILTALEHLYKSADTADTLCRFRGYPLTIPRISFDESTDILDDAADKLRITHEVNPRIS